MIEKQSLDLRGYKKWFNRQRKAGRFEGHPELEQAAEFVLLMFKMFKLNRRKLYPVEIKLALRHLDRLERALRASQ